MSKALAVAEDGSEQVVTRPWEQAVTAFVRLRAKPDQTVPLEWFLDNFEMVVPQRWNQQEWQKFQFAWLHNFERFRTKLLEEHMIDLRRIKNKGYQVIPSNEQTRIAIQDGMREVARALDKMNNRILYVNHKLLTKRERRENLEALHRMHLMRQALTKRRALSGLIGRKLRNEGLSGE